MIVSALLSIASVASSAQTSHDPVNRIIDALENDREFPMAIFKPQLTERQLSRFDDMRGCRALGAFISNDEDRVLNWSCADGRGYLMEAKVRYGFIINISINNVLIWPLENSGNG